MTFILESHACLPTIASNGRQKTAASGPRTTDHNGRWPTNERKRKERTAFVVIVVSECWRRRMVFFISLRINFLSYTNTHYNTPTMNTGFATAGFGVRCCVCVLVERKLQTYKKIQFFWHPSFSFAILPRAGLFLLCCCFGAQGRMASKRKDAPPHRR